jgi:hypothetical protein
MATRCSLRVIAVFNSATSVEKEIKMTKKADAGGLPKPRWMTQCDVIRYNLNIPQDLKHQLKKEALQKGMDVSTYICGLLSGDIKRKKTRQ